MVKWNLYILVKWYRCGGKNNEIIIRNRSKLFCRIFIWKRFGIFRDIIWWALLIGSGYLLITNWDSITVWMHSLDIVTGLDGYEDMSNGFIFICLLVSGFIFMLLLPVFAIILIVGVVFLNIVICTIVLLVSPSTYKK